VVRALAQFLEQYISREFLATDNITLADIFLAAEIHSAARVMLGAAEQALYPNIFTNYVKVVKDPCNGTSLRRQNLLR
jgi:elongation factor 1-gamma